MAAIERNDAYLKLKKVEVAPKTKMRGVLTKEEAKEEVARAAAESAAIARFARENKKPQDWSKEENAAILRETLKALGCK